MSEYRIRFNRSYVSGDELSYIAQVIDSGRSSGDNHFTKKCHALLERELGVPKVLLTTSCTHALEMAALLVEIKPGDEVIVPSFTFVSTVNAFVLRGARPVFIDIRPDTLNIDETQLERLITPRTKAIVLVHYAGVACEMAAILKIAGDYGIPVIEDNAHGLFGAYKGKYLGTFGCLATQSFHETKNFTCGEGGALIVNDPQYVERAEIIREKGTNRSRFFRGEIDKYTWVDVGSSYLPSDILAAFLYAQLEAREQIQTKRRRIWEFYATELRKWAHTQDVQLPTVPPHCDQAYHMFYMLLPSPEERRLLIAHLRDQGINAVFHYLPLHLSDVGGRFGARPGDCPVTEDVSDRLLRLPFYNDLTTDDQAYVIAAVNEFKCDRPAPSPNRRATKRSPKISVIIPAYNGAKHIAETIQSVLNQTYPDFELIVVDDASTDRTGEAVRQFDDPRLKYIGHDQNRGAMAARNTGLRASAGEAIAFLDQDDIFHPEKLETHIDFLGQHPEIGVTYNSRFDLGHSSSEIIYEIRRPPLAVSLKDLVLGHPFAPSDMIVRRDWAFRVGLYDEKNYTFGGGERNFTCRLALNGCQFGGVDRALNYRRYHSNRKVKDPARRCQVELDTQEKVFADPRCPADILALRPRALVNTYLVWICVTLAQDDTALGQIYLREAVQLKPSILEGQPCELIKFLVDYVIADETRDHRTDLKRMLAQFPPEMGAVLEQTEWAIARGYLLKGMRDIMWDRLEAGRAHFAQAAELDAEVDESLLRILSAQLISYEIEFGSQAAQNALQKLTPFLLKVSNQAKVRWLNGHYSINQAFQSYHTGQFVEVPRKVMQAVTNDPSYLTNRGVTSIFLRSMWHRFT